MHNISLNDISASEIKSFFTKLALVNKRYSEKDDIPSTGSKDMLKTRIHELEEELEQTKQEKNHATIENQKKIDELTVQLLSLKSIVENLVQAKRERLERLKHLERKINRSV